jgi:DNA-directed RNA polymerase subunit L
MEIKVLEESKNKILFQLKDEDHTFCNLLRQSLVSNDAVKLATYKIDHPLVGIPQFIVETKDKDPKKVLMEAAKEIQKELDKFKKSF